MAAAEAHELALFEHLQKGLDAIPGIIRYGRAARRTATAYFTLPGTGPGNVAEHLARHRVNVWSGHSYAWEATGALGIRESGGAVRAGLVHYNDRSDVDRLLDALTLIGPAA
jgi:selenocysteine lyase/cysteine desulfurase